jgi:hypothetical protein
MSWSSVSPERFYRPKFYFFLLVIVSFVVYTGMSLATHHVDDPSLLDSDESDYYNLAGNLIHNNYTFDLRRPPIHVLILCILRLLAFNNLRATQVLVSLTFSFSGPMMYLLARRIFGHNRLALTIGAATIFWPPFLFYGNTLYSETTALPLFVLTLISIPPGSVIEPDAPGGRVRSSFAGMLLGLCILVRPMYLLFSPLAVAILFLEESKWSVAMRRAGLVTVGCLLVVLPWSAYITSKAGAPILVSANDGETLGGGLNPALIEKGYETSITPDGRRTWFGPGKWLQESATGYLNDDEQKLPYAERDVIMRRRAIAWIVHNPGSALRLQCAKLLYMWGLYPFWNGATQTFLGNVPTIALSILSILSLVRFRHYLRKLSRFWFLPLFVSFVALISWGSWRFREPGDLGLIVLSVLFLWSLFVNPKHLIEPTSGGFS